jgi:hypothetical protein
MNKTLFKTPLLLFSMLSTYLYAQSVEPCGTDLVHKELLKSSETYRSNFLDGQNQIKTFIEKAKKSRVNATETVYTIPLVIHILEPSNTSTLLTDSEINTIIANLNNQLRAGTGYTLSQNINVQFALAKRDPNCQATTGINRINMSSNAGYVANGLNYANSDGIDEEVAKAVSNWGNVSYYNLWIVNEIDGKVNNGVVGYAYFPGASASVDGAIMIAPRLKDNGSTLLIHELGHAFNIYHTFNGSGGTKPNYTCPANTNPYSDGDACADTDPMHVGGTFISSNCQTSYNAINPCTGNPYGNLSYNIMNYTYDACSLLFTADQKDRFRASLLTTRSSLLTSQALTPPPSTAIAAACLPTVGGSTNYSYGVTEFSFNNQVISKSSVTGVDGYFYIDNSCNQMITVSRGQSYPVTVKTLNQNPVRVYIDYNNDGDFTDANETIASGTTSGSPRQLAFTYTPPNSGVLTNQPLRIRVMSDPSSALNSCSLPGNATGSGQAKDYSIMISVPCTPPSAPTVSSTTVNSGQTASLTATNCTGGTVKWYSAATNGTLLATANSYTSPALGQTTSYYASCTVNCESTTRSQGTVTVITCPTNLTLASSVDDINGGIVTKESSSKITATNAVLSGKATYSAGKTVELLPGFKTNEGTVFTATTGGCVN